MNTVNTSEHTSISEMSCQTNLTSLFNEVASLVAEVWLYWYSALIFLSKAWYSAMQPSY